MPDSFKTTLALLRDNAAEAPGGQRAMAHHLREQAERLLQHADHLRARTIGMLAGEAEPYRARARILEEYAATSKAAAQHIIDQLDGQS